MFVPPYDDANVIAGAGTAARELLAQCPDLDQVWVPVGGGGLAAGTVIAAGESADVVLAEPALARDAKNSLESGVLSAAMPPVTVADGLRTALGKLNFEVLRGAGVPVYLASEEGYRALDGAPGGGHESDCGTVRRGDACGNGRKRACGARAGRGDLERRKPVSRNAVLDRVNAPCNRRPPAIPPRK